MTSPAKYVTRKMWGSTFNYTNNTPMPPSPWGTALHWEGTRLGTFAHSTCAGRVRSIEKFHVEKRGWAGIAYNALVCPHGYIYEGRGLRYRSAANGDVPQNNAYFAVCYLGGPGDPLTVAAQDDYIRAVQWLVADGNAGDKVVGHRDLTATSCPGDVIYGWLKTTDFTGGTPPVPTVAVWGKPDTWKIGSVGPDVTLLGERLVVWAKALSLPPPYAEGPGPLFTDTDRIAVAEFQRAQGWTGSDADGYPGVETFRLLASIPPAPTPEETLVETLSGNLAAYDKVYGMRTREKRAATVIPDYLDNHQPHWFHFQECSADMLDEMDAYMKKRSYRRVPEGGKGRESWYDTKAGIVIVEAKLLNVEHMLLKDTKEHLVIAYTKNGVGAVDVNFHNENEGSTFQSVQLRDVMTHAREMADKHKYDRANILITGDANFKGAAAFAKAQLWSEVIYTAAKKIDLGYVSTNGWVNRVVGGRRIDVDVVRRDSEILEAEQHFAAVNGKPISDHWLHRVVRRLK